MLSYKEIHNLEYTQKKYFIESNRADASYFQWLFSKGTNFTCYIEYLNSLTEEKILNGKIDTVRTVLNAFSGIISLISRNSLVQWLLEGGCIQWRKSKRKRFRSN